MSEHFDIIISGAGMIGATLATGLSDAGFSVAVIEPQPAKEFDPKADPALRVSAVSYASEQVLRHVGVWPLIQRKRLCPYRRLAVNEMHPKRGLVSHLPDISKWATTEFCAEDLGKSHLGHIIENQVIQSSLLELLESKTGVSLFCPDKADKIELSGPTKTLQLASGIVLTAPLVIGADGANSLVRQRAGITQSVDQYGQQAFVCGVTYQGEQSDITWQTFTPEGPRAFLPLADCNGEHHASLVWYDRPEQIRALGELSDEALLRILAQTYPAELPPLLRCVGRAHFPLARSHAQTYVKPGVALVGDAAHTINPLAGQGANLGFLDAAVLIEVLGQARIAGEVVESPDVLRRYENARRKQNLQMMQAMDVFYYGFSNSIFPLQIARNLGLGLANRFSFARNRVAEYAMGLAGDIPRLARQV